MEDSSDLFEALSERLIIPSSSPSEDDKRNNNHHRDAEAAEEHESSEIISGGDGDDMIVVDPLQAVHGPRGGQPQQQGPPEFRDAPFAVAFLSHMVVILFLALFWGLGSLKQQQKDDSSTSSSSSYIPGTGLLGLAFFTSLVSVGLSAASLEFMTRYGEQLIQTSVISSCGIMVLIVITMFARGGTTVLAWLWILALIVTIWYAYRVWHRIPFAASNLRTAIAAIQSNYGVCVLGYTIAFCGNIWVLIWSLAVLGVNFKESDCGYGVTCESNMGVVSFTLLLLSYFWTSEVLKNVLHVTVAGVVGTWWFAPHETGFVQDCFRRATSFSFGSICMGSLLMAVIQTLQYLANMVRRHSSRQGAGGALLCIAECILFYIEAVAEYFNRWAFVYIGLYGYDYLTAGEKVLVLFRERGWSVVVSDDLVYRTLTLVSVVIGALTGLAGMLLAKATGWATPMTTIDGNGTGIFLLCFVLGFSLANITMSMVCIAVDTVIVSFAEAPGELQTNHPALSRQMRTAWRQVYPEECQF